MNKSEVLSLLTVFSGFLSFLGCIYACINIYNEGYKPCKCNKNWRNQRPTISGNVLNTPLTMELVESITHVKRERYIIMIDIIFWMCITDGLHGIQMMITWTPQTKILIGNINWFYNAFECKIIAFFAMILSFQSPTWHIILAYHLWYLLFGYTLQTLK